MSGFTSFAQHLHIHPRRNHVLWAPCQDSNTPPPEEILRVVWGLQPEPLPLRCGPVHIFPAHDEAFSVLLQLLRLEQWRAVTIKMLRRKPFTYLGSLSPSLTQSRTSLLISGSLTVLWPAPSTAPTTWLHRLDARPSQPSRLDRPKPCRDCCAQVATPAHPLIALSLIMQRRSTHI